MQLQVSDTKHFHYLCQINDELEQRFKRVMPFTTLKLLLPDGPFSEETRRVIDEYFDRLAAEYKFAKEVTRKKEIEGHERMVIYGFDACDLAVGRIAINYADTKWPSIDIKVAPVKQRQGYGYEMLQAVITAAFEQYDYDHLEYDLFATNDASRKLIQKLGGRLTFQDYRGECYSIDREEFMKRT